jgi:predicted O-methyltransferase YrrM
MNAAEAVDLRSWAIANRDMVDHVETLTGYAKQAKTIIEFGVRGAVSTWAMLDGLPKRGRMWSVDVVQFVVPVRVSSDPRWTFILGDDRDPDVQAQLPAHADLVFIDTTHEYEHTALELAFALTRTPKRIVCHDAEWPGVARATWEFCTREHWYIASYAPAGDVRGPFGLLTLEPSPI